MWALSGMTGCPSAPFAARSGVSNSPRPVSGAPEVLKRPNTFSWSDRRSVSQDSMSILIRRATR